MPTVAATGEPSASGVSEARGSHRLVPALTPPLLPLLAPDAPTAEQLLALAAAIPGVVFQFIARPDGRRQYLYISPGIELTHEVSMRAAYADAERVLACIVEEDRPGHRSLMEYAIATRNRWRHEYRIRTASGRLKWIHSEALPQLQEDGSTLWHGVLSDVTDRHRLLDSLATSETFNATILNSLAEHIAVLDERGVIVAVNEAWRRFGAENGAPPEFSAWTGLSYQRVCTRAGKAPVDATGNRAWQGIEAVIAGRLEEFSLEYPCDSPDTARWFAMRVHPLAPPRRGAVVAHLDITRRKLAEQALRESQRSLLLAQNAGRVGNYSIDLSNGRWQASAMVIDICGIAPAVEYSGEDWIGLIHPEHRQRAAAHYDEVLATGCRYSQEYRIVRPLDGETRWIACEGELDPRPDGKARLIGTIHDITESKRAQRMQLRAIIDAAPYGMFLVGEDGAIQLHNAAAAEIFGYPLGELQGLPIDRLAPANQRDAHARYIRHYWQDAALPRSSLNRELTARHRDGHEFPVEVSLSPMWLDGQKVLIAAVNDISARKNDELRLKHSEERLEMATRAGGIGIWDWLLDSDTLLWNETMFALYGLRPDEFGGTSDDWLRCVHPDDRERVHASDLRALRDTHEHDCEFRIVWPNGSVRHIKSVGKVLRDEGGHPRRMLGTCWDITAQKHVSNQLQLAATVFSAIREGILVADENNRIVAVNPAFTRLTGYTAEEALGETTRLLKSGRHDTPFYRDMWQTLKTHGHWEGEIWNRRKGGEIYPEWLMISAVHDETGTLRSHVAMFSDITEQKRAEQAIWQEANFDALTGLPNRRMLRDRLEQELKKAHRTRLPLALLFLDLDHFKEVNDTLGHGMGDLLLKEAAQRLCQCVREADTVARFGGDEFTIVLGELEDRSSIDRIAQEILRRLAAPFRLPDETAYVSASIGVTLFPDDARDIDALLKNADQAMYAAKRQGRNRYSYFTPAMQELAQKRMHLTRDLRSALANNEFRVYYQPIVTLADGRIHKAEALIRWQHPQRGLVSPAEFIPLAEETGLINDIGDWVFRTAATQVAHWRKHYCPDLQISVNKSPVQFRNKDDDLAPWFDWLKGLGLPGQSMVIEITEGLLMEASPLIREKLLALRDAGIQVSLDDFGTGYSSLSYLKKFDIDYLKIDQSFVRNLAPDSDDLALCQAIIVMAHKLGIHVIAEGVETEAQRALLGSAGCDFGQGYLFAEPLPPEDFERRLAG
ncbi:EAL domain-containing protein [Rhodocyclus tenuis]|uniref:EAL domain-containing protein n=1 Tax=Rhodocyclus gracilis TaxID=2929842 RepID=A0ABX0WLT4_9RHOO|nr:PAS domain-containing protein [Rhodocyclus gracilis]NJA89674.1 EAL domain-containing protein [Rhodocyclus gracilis]